MIHAFVMYCMVLNPHLCKTQEIVPVEGSVTSLTSCMMGGMMGSAAEFTYQGARWRIKGIYCKSQSDNSREYLTRKWREHE